MGVRHFSYVFAGLRNWRAYGHHELDRGTPPGVYRCGVCGRLVIRGMGKWWA